MSCLEDDPPSGWWLDEDGLNLWLSGFVSIAQMKLIAAWDDALDRNLDRAAEQDNVQMWLGVEMKLKRWALEKSSSSVLNGPTILV